MPISNRDAPHIVQQLSQFTGAERREIDDALDELANDHHAPSYKCSDSSVSYGGDTLRTIEVGANGVRIEYKVDNAGLVTIIDIYRSPWHQIKLLLDFSP